jgi:putative glycosyltransferase (TIGR04372 family)
LNASDYKLFWSHQINQIREEGWTAVQFKLKMLIIALIFSPLLLFLRVLRPLFWIRFGYFTNERIGHFVFDVEYYLTERKLGLYPAKAIDVFFYQSKKSANVYFAKMVQRNLKVHKWVRLLFQVNSWMPNGEYHKIFPARHTVGSRDKKGLFIQVEPQLKFNNEEIVEGQSFLHSIGMKDKKFICLIVRDSAYLNKSSLHKSGKWDYHNFRDADINTFEETALALAEKDYGVFRMGKMQEKPFMVENPNIFDYAKSKYRSDFLDIWLMANCFFCISTGTGLDEVSRIFRRPSVYVNYLTTSSLVTYDHVITTPKHLLWQEMNKRLTLSEHLFHSYSRTEEYEDAKIKIQDLSSKEILKAVLEMEARLTGSWQDSAEDQQLQNRFWQIFKSYPDFEKNHGIMHPEARVGAHFLRNNSEWLN